MPGRASLVSPLTSGSTDDNQDHILQTIRYGQAALQKLRWRIGVSWLCLCVVCAAFHFYWLHQCSSVYQEPAPTDWYSFFEEFFLNTRLVVPVLVPLGDDVVLMRCVLAFEAGYAAFIRTKMMLSVCNELGDVWNSLTVPNLLWLERGYFFVFYAFWVMGPRSPRSMKRWIWFSVFMAGLPDAVYDFFSMRMLQNWSTRSWLLASAVMLCVVLWPQAVESLRTKLRCWVETPGATRAAAAIACLIGRVEPEVAIRQAQQSFRSVDVSRLAFEHLKDNRPDPCLHALTEPTTLGDCDAFISHSWHDSASAKWEALQTWRTGFRARHGREPRVWFDKVCIDQHNIEHDLQHLPISLSGCKRLLILCGPTYLTRLWCIIEIFTYIMMGGNIADVEVIPVLNAGSAKEDQGAIVSSFENFDAANCNCFDPADKARILTVIETAFGTLGAFNGSVAKVLYQIHMESSALAQISVAIERQADRASSGS